MEHKHTRKGGPVRHLHLKEDEWFYVLEGEYLIEVGGDLFSIGHGDSVLVPRRTPHAYAFQGNGIGRLLLTFSPSGKLPCIA
jgi:mannose-6-phosphate isomerase-like protein (cupin superfamily)